MAKDVRDYAFWYADVTGDNIIDIDAITGFVAGDFPLSPGDSANALTRLSTYLGTDDTEGDDGFGDRDLFPLRDLAEEAADPVISITPEIVSLPEGNAGTRDFGFQVRRTGDLSEASSVRLIFDAGDTNAECPSGDFVSRVNQLAVAAEKPS